MSRAAALVLSLLAFSALAAQQLQIRSLKRALGESGATPTGARRSRDLRSDDLAERVRALEERVQRLGRIALQDPRAGGTAAPLTEDEIAALRDDVSAVAAERALTTPEGRERLRAAIREEQELLDEERRLERTQRMKQARDERLAKFIDEARLSETQAKSVRERYEGEWEQVQALFEEVRGGAKSWNDVRPEMRSIRGATDEWVKGTLDSTQYAAWEAMRAEWGAGGPPPR